MAEPTPLRDDRPELASAIETVADGELNGRIVLPLVEETLSVGTQTLETGVVRVHKRTIERTETVSVDTLHETVSVERVPVERFLDAPVEIRQEGDTTIVPVFEEVVVVEKRLLLREEVRITRTRSTVPQERTVALRREEAVIERDEPTA